MAEEQLDVLVTCDTSELDRAKAAAVALESQLKKGFKTKLEVDTSGIKNGQTALGNLSNKAASAASVLKGVSSSLNIISATLQNIGNNMQMVGRFGLIGSTILGGTAVAALAKLTKTGVTAASTLENVQQQILAQGVDEGKTAEVLSYIRTYANQSAFSVSNLGSAISDVNSYIGDIDKSKKVVEVFGTSLMATGKTASDLARVAPNLGQLSTDAFGKTDYKELVRGVPAIAQALRDMDISSWEDFNIALGDNPDTKDIERTGNALDLVTEALDRYNIKTDAFVRSQESLSARLENTQGVIEDTLGQAVQNSGLYDKLGIMLDNVAQGFEKNIPLITDFYSWLGDTGVRISEFLRDFDFKEFGIGFKDAIQDIIDTGTEFINKNKRTFDQVKNFFTEGKEGAEGLGATLGNVFGASTKLYFGGTLVKALSSVISLLSTGAGLAGNLAGGLSGVFGAADKALSNNGGLSGYVGKHSKGKTPSVPVSVGEGLLGNNYITRVERNASKQQKTLRSVFKNLYPVSTVSSWFNQPNNQLQDGLQVGSNKLQTTLNKYATTTGNIVRTAGNTIKDIGTGTVNTIKNAGSFVGGKLKSALGFVSENFLGIGTDIFLITQAVKQFDELPSGSVVKSGFAKIAGVMAGIATLNGIVGKVSQWAGISQAMGALSNALNAGSIIVMTKSLQALKDLPSEDAIFTGFSKISLFAAGAAGLNLIQGGIGTVTGGLTTVAQVIGAFTNAINAGSMVILAKSLKSLDGLPDDATITSGLEKLKNVTLQLAGISFMSATLNLGGLTSLLGNFATWNNAGIVKNIQKAAESLVEIGNLIIPENTEEKVNKIIDQMVLIKNSFSGLDVVADWFKKWDSSILTKMTTNVEKAGTALETISGINVPKNISTKLQEITDAMKQISDFFDGNWWESLGEKWDSGNLTQSVENVATAGEALQRLDSIDIGNIANKKDTTIKDIGNAMQAIGDTFGGNMFERFFNVLSSIDKKWESGNITQVVENIANAAEDMSSLNDVKIPTEQHYQDIVKAFTAISESLSDIDIPNGADLDVENLAKSVDNFTLAAQSLDSINDIKVPNTSQITVIQQAIEQVWKSLQELVGIAEGGTVPTATTEQLTSLQELTTQLSGILEQVESLSGYLEDIQGRALNAEAIANNVKTTLDGMMVAINSLRDVMSGWESAAGTTVDASSMDVISGTTGNVFGAAQLEAIDSLVEMVNGIVDKLSSLSGSLEGLQAGVVNIEAVKGQLEQLKQSMSSLFAFMNDMSLGEGSSADTPVSAFQGFFESEGDDLFTQTITKIKGIVTKLGELQGLVVEVQNAQVAAEAMKTSMDNLKNSLSEMLQSLTSPEFTDLANQANADGITTAIDGVKTFVQNVKTAIESLNDLTATATVSGTNLSAAVLAGFLATDMSGMKTHVETPLQEIAVFGTTYGQQLSNNFNSATADLGKTAIQQANAVKAALEAIPTTISVNVSVSSNVADISAQLSSLQSQANNTIISPRTMLAAGGFVEKIARFAKGGVVGNSVFASAAKGTDKIPAMLSEGEYVQQRKSVGFWGKGLMEALNQRNVPRVSQLLQGRLNSVSRTINNTVNNNNQPTIHQTFYGGDSQNYGRLNRLVRGF